MTAIDHRHSIYKRKGRAGWTLEYRDGDARKPVQRSFPRKVDAEAAWEDVKDERRRLAGLRVEMPTFRTYANRWLEHQRNHIRPSSVSKYEWALAHLDALAAHPLDTIGRETVRVVLGAKAATLSRSSADSIASVLHTCLAEAVADGYLRANPADGGGFVRRPRGHRQPPKAMERGQLRAFLDGADGVWRDFFHVSWALGLRPGEAMALQPADVDFERRRVRVERTVLVQGGIGPTKTGEVGWVDLPPGAAEILQPRVDARGVWLFPGRVAVMPMGHATVEHAFKRIAARVGLPGHFTPHCLRHTFAALHLQRGASVYYVQRMLRHSSIQITVDTYGSWLDPGRPEIGAGMEADALAEPAHTPPGVDVSRESVEPQNGAVSGEEL